MSAGRVAVILLGLTVIGLATVQLRGRHAQYVHDMQDLRAIQLRLQHKLWELQLEKARLTAPLALRERAGRLSLDVIPPHDAGRSEATETVEPPAPR